MHSVKKSKTRFTIFSVFFTFFIDNLGATLIFPILAPLFLNPHETILPASMAYNLKAALLGLFLCAFPLAQFLFAPLIGSLADRYGRKKAFVVTTALSLLGFMLCAISIERHLLSFLFLSRFIMGASAGNLSICLTALSDLSDCQKTRVRYYSLGSALAGVTFILGPFIGGKLSDPIVHPLFNPAFPFWIGAGLTFINLLFLFFAFVETMQRKRGEKLDFIEGVHNIQHAIKIPSIKEFYLMYFFYLLSWNMLFQFIPAFLVSNFGKTNSAIGDISALMGMCWILGSIILSKTPLHHVSSKLLLVTASIIFAIVVIAASFADTINMFVLMLGVGVFIASFGWPLCTSAITQAASEPLQGRILGFSQSIQSLAMMLAPILIGPFLSKHSSIPFMIAAFFSLVFGHLARKASFKS